MDDLMDLEYDQVFFELCCWYYRHDTSNIFIQFCSSFNNDLLELNVLDKQNNNINFCIYVDRSSNKLILLNINKNIIGDKELNSGTLNYTYFDDMDTLLIYLTNSKIDLCKLKKSTNLTNKVSKNDISLLKDENNNIWIIEINNASHHLQLYNN